MNIVDISHILKIRRNVELALLFYMIPLFFLICVIITSFNYVNNRILFSMLIITNFVIIILAIITYKLMLKRYLLSFISFFTFSYCILPVVIIVLANSNEASLMRIKSLHSFFKLYFESFSSQYEEGWVTILILFSPILILFGRCIIVISKNQEIINEFNLPHNFKDVSYTASAKRLKVQGIVMFLIYIFYGVVVIFFTILGIISLFFILVGGLDWIRTFIRLLFETHLKIIKFIRSLFVTARGYVTANLFEILDRDKRPPILWIRSFKDDRLEINNAYGVTFEERVVKQLKLYGPVITIGNPHEKVPSLGAAREYFKNNDWQNVIDKFINGASFIVTILGDSKGLEIEYAKIKQLQKNDKLLIVMPPIDIAELQRRWVTFLNLYNTDLNKELISIDINDRLLLIKTSKGGIETVIYSNVKSKYAYRLAFIKTLKEEAEEAYLSKFNVSIREDELKYAIGKEEILNTPNSDLDIIREDIRSRAIGPPNIKTISQPSIKTEDKTLEDIQAEIKRKIDEEKYNHSINRTARIILIILGILILLRIIQVVIKDGFQNN